MVGPLCQSRPLPHRAESLQELAPLFELCKTGKLFDVQKWIAAGKPVNPPAEKPKHSKFKSPLLMAIDHGFHSLVEVLLKGGAIQEPDDCDSPMGRALGMRRRDLVELLVEHGYQPQTVDMTWVLSSWDPGLMEYFIERGADLNRGNPFAWAFCCQIRTALNIFKRYREQFPALQEQANIALRHHCMKGNMKWISLMLWAGADPFQPGASSYTEELREGHEGMTAIEFAAIYNHWDVFKLKSIRFKPTHPGMRDCIFSLGDDEGFEILKDLLARGLKPNDDNGKCSAIQSWLSGIDWVVPNWRWGEKAQRRNIDSDRARKNVRSIHLIAKHGGKWVPSDSEIKSARRSLLKMIPDYTVEFVWIMSKYNACRPQDITALLASPSMKVHISPNHERIKELLAAMTDVAAESLPG